MFRVTFLSSGNGGNLKFLHLINKNMESSNFHLNVIADRDCGASSFAEINGIECKIIEVKNDNQLELSKELKKSTPDFIFTTFHKIISPNVLKLHGERMVNLHYSLLPRYNGMIGMKSVQKAIENNDFFLGVTTHKVTDDLDAGPILFQSHFQNPGDFDIAANTSFRIGCLQIWSVLQNQASGGKNLINQDSDLIPNVCVYHSPSLTRPPEFVNETFWSEVASR